MSSSKQFQIKVTAVRRKPVKKVSESEAEQLDRLLMEVITHPLLNRLPFAEVLRTDLTIAVRDLAKGNFV